MKYSVFILRRAQKELSKLPIEVYERVKEVIISLDENPRPSGCKKLTAREGWRIQAGDYRVVYEIDDKAKKVVILHVGHRRDVYR